MSAGEALPPLPEPVGGEDGPRRAKRRRIPCLPPCYTVAAVLLLAVRRALRPGQRRSARTLVFPEVVFEESPLSLPAPEAAAGVGDVPEAGLEPPIPGGRSPLPRPGPPRRIPSHRRGREAAANGLNVEAVA